METPQRAAKRKPNSIIRPLWVEVKCPADVTRKTANSPRDRGTEEIARRNVPILGDFWRQSPIQESSIRWKSTLTLTAVLRYLSQAP
jgi:hypothetical protein